MISCIWESTKYDQSHILDRMRCRHFNLCYYYRFFLKIHSDTSQIYVWVVLFDALQGVHGRSELLGFSIYIGTETELSLTNLAVNGASQLRFV